MDAASDPDYFFEAASVASVASRSSGGTSFLLRSACRLHQGPCNEGHGIEFHSRISPSPARSYHKKRRRRSTMLESSPEAAEDEPRPNPAAAASARRDLSDDLAKVERTSGWVANLKRMEKDQRTLKLTTTTITQERTVSQRIIQTPLAKMPDWSRSVSGGSPRLQAFDGETWKRSPRTGYTYVDSATYRQTWTPDREIPMPHMARRPLDEYNDGEVSFGPLNLDFSSDEEEIDTKILEEKKNFWATLLLVTFAFSLRKGSEWLHDVLHKLEVFFKLVAKQTILVSSQLFVALEMMLPYLIPYQMPNSGNDFPDDHSELIQSQEDLEEEITYIKRITRFYHDIYNWNSTDSSKVKKKEEGEEIDNDIVDEKKNFGVPLLLVTFTFSLRKGSEWLLNVLHKLEVFFKLVSSQLFVALETMLPYLIPYQMPNSGNDFPDDHSELIQSQEDLEEEITYIKRITRFYHDIYNWNTSDSSSKAIFILYCGIRSAFSFISASMGIVKRAASRSTKAPKALLFLLIPSIFTNLVAEAQTVPGLATPSKKGPVINSEFVHKITHNIHEIYIWSKKSLNHVPDVRQAINSTIQVLTGLLLSVLVFFNPKNLWNKLPKISRKRVRRWRSRGPPTRFSARLRNLPVQFTGELPMRTKRRRKPAVVVMLPDEPVEQRIAKVMGAFEAKVALFNPGLIARSISSVVNKLGYFKEEEVELRRSLRLRGLAPEYDGLQDSTKRRPRRSLLQEEPPKPIEQLLRPDGFSILARIFAYFGYYDQAEILRRRSLRLQGLDPEYEGLTWGKRKRPRKSSRFLAFFGDYHDDDEVFFEYNEPNIQDGVLQRWLDSFLHVVGYLQYEDIHEEEEEEEEDDDTSYVEIPSESFVHLRQQHELFESSYFEPTEFEEGKIQVTKMDGSCLGIILILAIPLLLFLSMIIVDYKSTTEYAQLAIGAKNGLGFVADSIFGAFSALCGVLSSYYKTTMPKPTSRVEPIDYDLLAKQILDDAKFVNYIDQFKFSLADDAKNQLMQLLETRFQEVRSMQKLEPNDDHQLMDLVLDAESKVQQAHNEQVRFMQEIELSLQTIRAQNQDGREVAIVELQDKLTELANEVLRLDMLLTNCCKKDLDHQLIIQEFLHAQKSQFMTKDDFESELTKIISIVQHSLMERSKQEIFAIIDSKVTTVLANATVDYSHDVDPNSLTRVDIEKMVKSALMIYGADKTGAFDFALETAGGSVVSTRCTQMYTEQLPSYTWMGLWLPLPVWGPATNPRTAIQPGIMPGECWAFKGHEGFLVVKLSMPMKPTRFSIEHIPKSLSPNGQIDSAPKDFTVVGLTQEQDPSPEDLGKFTYDDQGEPLQFFDVANPREYAFAFVELRILSNHGNDKYTCLYRFRVHGQL